MNEITINYNEALEFTTQPTEDYWFWLKALGKGLPVTGQVILRPDMNRIKRLDIFVDICNMCWRIRWEGLENEI